VSSITAFHRILGGMTSGVWMKAGLARFFGNLMPAYQAETSKNIDRGAG
jgi:hypothetical protein